MNAKLTGLAVALVLLGSTNVFAGQPFGRDSVYASPTAVTYSSKSSTAAVKIRAGRSSVYASDVPAPHAPSTVTATAPQRPGRA